MAKRKPRKALSKKIRFEVFKRDSFICQYCGQSAPDTVLHVDHIEPVSKGGDNSIMNLVTSCIDCNQGKGARKLSDKTAVIVAKRQADELQERLEQIQMMADWQKELRMQSELEYKVFVDAFYGPINNDDGACDSPTYWGPSEWADKDIKRNIRRFGIKAMLTAVGIAHDDYLKRDDKGKYTDESIEEAFNKVGGICYNHRERGEPEFQ
jgi:hypothetical protein